MFSILILIFIPYSIYFILIHILYTNSHMKSIFFSFVFILGSFNLFSQTELTPTDQEGLVNFTIVDPKGIPEEGAIVTVDAVDKTFSKKAVADIDGKCQILIPEGAPFKVTVHKFNVDFDFGVQNLAIKPGSQVANFKLSIELVTTYKRIYTLDHLYFEPNEYDIKGLQPSSIAILNKLVDSLIANANMKIEIAGHTDNLGDDLTNLHLSQKRADAIRGYLIQKGIKEERVLAKGYGETVPVASNDSPEGRSFNRRTEVKIIEE